MIPNTGRSTTRECARSKYANHPALMVASILAGPRMPLVRLQLPVGWRSNVSIICSLPDMLILQGAFSADYSVIDPLRCLSRGEMASKHFFSVLTMINLSCFKACINVWVCVLDGFRDMLTIFFSLLPEVTILDDKDRK